VRIIGWAKTLRQLDGNEKKYTRGEWWEEELNKDESKGKQTNGKGRTKGLTNWQIDQRTNHPTNQLNPWRNFLLEKPVDAHSTNSPRIMEPESVHRRSPSVSNLSQRNQYIPFRPNVKTCFVIILPSMPRSSTWFSWRMKMTRVRQGREGIE